MTVPSFVNTGGWTSQASVATITPTLPGSRVNNNVLLSWIQVQATGKTLAVGGGWTIADSDNTNNSAAWAWRLVDGTEAAPVWSWTGNAAVQAEVQQWTGNTTPTPIGAKNKATAASSTTATVASLTSTADNSGVQGVILVSNSQTIPAPGLGYTSGTNSGGNGSDLSFGGTIYKSGSATSAISLAVTSCNWNSFEFEILGSGAAPANEPQVRSTQVVQEALETYSNATNIRATQVVQENLESYTNPTNIRATQVVLQVLRSVATTSPIYLTNCDVDVSFNGGPRWAATTVRVDQKSSRPLAHWKRGLDVDQWILTLAPRNTDPVSGAAYPDTINSNPWIAAAHGGALDGCTIEIFRAFFPQWPPFAPVIAPTGILSIFAGRIAEVDCTDTLVIITINDFRELMTTMVPTQVYSAQCRHTLFDYGCALAQGNFAATGTCSGSSTQSTIVATTDLSVNLALLGAGMTYTLGNIVMSSGLNTGFSRTISTWSSPSTVTVLNPFPFAIANGDTFTIYPGCDKTQASCAVFNNSANFGGFPFIPTVAAAL